MVTAGQLLRTAAGHAPAAADITLRRAGVATGSLTVTTGLEPAGVRRLRVLPEQMLVYPGSDEIFSVKLPVYSALPAILKSTVVDIRTLMYLLADRLFLYP
ncbi:hypothetical protein GXW82_00635 [Streptacidiphilus sp. 4-A2]|nr:hypothetical protein [Streptacidiphilus sp. 4-A2]